MLKVGLKPKIEKRESLSDFKRLSREKFSVAIVYDVSYTDASEKILIDKRLYKL